MPTLSASDRLVELQAALTPPPGRRRDALIRELQAAALEHIQAEDWASILALRAWAQAHPLFATPQAPLRGFLRLWEEALLSGAPLPTAAALVRDDVPTAVASPWERLAARATWDELRPLLADDAAAWSVAEARVLRGERLGGRSPISGMPLRLYRWEPPPEVPHFSVLGMSESGGGFASPLAPAALPAPLPVLRLEPAWTHLLSPWSASAGSAIKVQGSGVEAIATLLAARQPPRPPGPVSVGACTWKEALGAMMRMHGNMAPYTEGQGLVQARRAVWQLLASAARRPWPTSGGALQAAMKGWRWLRYDPHEPYADPEFWSLFLALEDPRRGLAWAVYAWVTD